MPKRRPPATAAMRADCCGGAYTHLHYVFGFAEKVQVDRRSEPSAKLIVSPAVGRDGKKPYLAAQYIPNLLHKNTYGLCRYNPNTEKVY